MQLTESHLLAIKLNAHVGFGSARRIFKAQNYPKSNGRSLPVYGFTSLRAYLRAYSKRLDYGLQKTKTINVYYGHTSNTHPQN